MENTGNLKVTSVAKFMLMDQIGIPMEEQTKLYIEGYASVNRMADGSKNVDRDQEIYDIPSLDIANFKKNGPILFGHDWNAVIGTVTSIEKTFEGLFIKAEIHKVPGYESVFYGIQHNLIKAFSISAIPKNFNYLEEEDALELLDAELVEISVLAVPSNAQSLFSITNAKSLTFNAKEIATQNDMTLCELKGLCGLKPKEKELDMSEKTVDKPDEKMMDDKPEEKPDEKMMDDKPEEKPEDKMMDKPTPELATPEVTSDTIADAVIRAQEKADEIRLAKEETKVQEAADKVKLEADAAKARIDQGMSYITETTDAFLTASSADLDTDTIEAFYELISDSAEKIETRISDIVKEQAAA